MKKKIVLPINYTKKFLDRKVGFQPYEIVSKSLDARKKEHLKWVVVVQSPQKEKTIPLKKDKQNNKKKVLIAGSGPAGLFAADIFSSCGYDVTVFEKGCDVLKRKELIESFESGGKFSTRANYVFGEGGAGTFSDGKLSSRTKSIKVERAYIYDRFVSLGAPKEIVYLNHPHIGSDYLIKVILNFRRVLEKQGVKFLFEEEVLDIKINKEKIVSFITDKEEYKGDSFIIAGGHSNYPWYRKLISKRILFNIKPTAIGARVEHEQSLINLAQWGKEKVKGLSSAEYRLSAKTQNHSVYTFCMCPGGRVVQSTPVYGQSIVNGMSDYTRDGKFANSAVVCAFNPLEYNCPLPEDILNYLEALERKYFDLFKSFKLPAMNIDDFIKGKVKLKKNENSYSHGIEEGNLFELLPNKIIYSLQEGLVSFSKKIKGFTNGIIMGLESKTSSPVQIVRDKDYSCTYKNLYICGEMSGFAGGIVSSAADAIKVSLSIINR